MANEKFIEELYCGEVKTSEINIGEEKKTKTEGWIAISLSDEKLVKYNGHLIKVKIEVIEDLGEMENPDVKK